MNKFIIELLQFLKKPTEVVRGKGKNVTSDILNLLLLDILLMMIALPLAQLLDTFDLVDFDTHDLNNILTDTNIILALALVSIVVPVIEEFIFRLPLKMGYNVFPMWRLMAARKMSDADEAREIYKTKKAWLAKYPYIFYGMALLFALIHLTNYQISLSVIIFSFILCLPQFILAVLVSYARLKHGLWSSMLLHGLHNLIFSLFAYAAM